MNETDSDLSCFLRFVYRPMNLAGDAFGVFCC